MANPNCEPGECDDPKYTTPVKVKPFPTVGGGGHEFVTSLPSPDDARSGVEYVLMDDPKDTSTYKGTYIFDPELGAFIASSSGGGGGGVVVDNTLSTTSTNPVQNKVITEELNKTVPVSKGGTGATSFEANKVLVGTGGNVVGTRSITGTIAENSSALPTSDAVFRATKNKAEKSEIPDVSGFATKQELASGLGTKQPTLVSGNNIKTVNGKSLLGAGNIDIEGGDGKAFIAEYGVTTAQEIIAYIESSNEPFPPMLIKRNNVYYTVTTAQKQDDTKVIVRSFATLSGDYYMFTYTITNGSWASSSHGFQKLLESGTNIKTINNQSLLGAGNIDISGGGGDVYQYSVDSTDPNLQPITGQTDAYVMTIPDADWDAIWAAKNAGKVVVVRVKKLYDQTNGDDGLVVPMVFGDPTTNPYGSGFGYYMEEPGGLSENRLVVVTLQKTSTAKLYLQYFTVGGGSNEDELFYITVDASAFTPSASDPNVLETELASPYTMAELTAILAKTNPESIILRIITTNGVTKDLNDIVLNTMSPTGFEGDLFLTTVYQGVSHSYAKFIITPENGKTMLRMYQGNLSTGTMPAYEQSMEDVGGNVIQKGTVDIEGTVYGFYEFFYKTGALPTTGSTKVYSFANLLAGYTIQNFIDATGITSNGIFIGNGRTDNDNRVIVQQFSKNNKTITLRAYQDFTRETSTLKIQFIGTKN